MPKSTKRLLDIFDAIIQEIISIDHPFGSAAEAEQIWVWRPDMSRNSNTFVCSTQIRHFSLHCDWSHYSLLRLMTRSLNAFVCRPHSYNLRIIATSLKADVSVFTHISLFVEHKSVIFQSIVTSSTVRHLALMIKRTDEFVYRGSGTNRSFYRPLRSVLKQKFGFQDWTNRWVYLSSTNR